MKRNLLLFSVLAFMFGFCAKAQTYTMATSAADLQNGASFIFVGYADDGTAYAMGYQKSNNRFALMVSENGGSVTATPATDPTSQTEPFEFTLGTSNGHWTFFDALNNGYLYAAASDGNKLKTQSTLDANGEWVVTFGDDGACELVAQGSNTRKIMRFNDTDLTNVLFNCYASTSTIVDPVYIFVAGGQSTIDPEPSNYPTNFTAEVERNTVELEWNASTGAQTPRGYLVLGSTGSITVPADGTPVTNDLNASDGNVAFNVLSGTECEFSGLMANTTYNFAIFPFTNSGANIDYKTDGSYPTASATTENVASLVDTDFNGSLAPFTAYNVKGEQEWATSSYSGVNFAKMSGYASGSAFENEDWLISPNLFANGKYQSISVSFDNAYKFDGNALMVMISGAYDGQGDPNDFQWEDITDDFDWSAGEYAWQESGEMIYEIENANSLYIAFVYTSTDAAASTWEVTDVEIYGMGYDAVEEVSAQSLNIHPNPASSSFSFNVENDVTVEIIDMTGRVVMSVEAKAGENNVNVSELSNGVYFVKMDSSVAKFVKK